MTQSEIRTPNTSNVLPIRAAMQCPHCWHKFPTEQLLYVAECPDLLGDIRLGADAQQRFLPTRFAPDTAALDSKGFKCRKVACPRCHLEIPRSVLDMAQRFVSIIGAPASGKSYFLAGMSWRMRSTLSESFEILYADADPELNHRIHEYESMQFMNSSPDAIVTIDKTEVYGDFYNSVLIDGQDISYPQPYIFSLTPQANHPNVAVSRRISHSLCLYDNAGESFLPGGDSASHPVTQHLAHSDYLLFLYDPTQDPRFREACKGLTDDPQMSRSDSKIARESDVRQDIIFTEMAKRIRQHVGLGSNAQHTSSLIVVLTKFDCWKSLLAPFLRDVKFRSPVTRSASGNVSLMNTTLVDDVSAALRKLLSKYCPELVNHAESFASDVAFIPVSATGCSPSLNKETSEYGFRARDIKPVWVEVPMLYALAKKTRGIIPTTNGKKR